jgi:hypothetical protein
VALFSSPAFAQSVTAADDAFGRFMTSATGAGKQTISFGSGGQVIASQGVPSLTVASGAVQLDRPITFRNPSGQLLSGSARVAVPGAVLGRVIGRRVLQSLPVLGAGYALWELADELGFNLDNSSGDLVVSVPDPSVCTVAPCREYFLDNVWAGHQAQCVALVGDYNEQLTSWNWYLTGLVVTDTFRGKCVFAQHHRSTNAFFQAVIEGNFLSRASDPAPSAGNLSSIQDFVDAVAAKSGWPPSTAILDVLSEVGHLTRLEPWMGPSTVSGPATSQGPQAVTQESNGDTTTTTTTYTHTYNGGDINTATSTTTTVTNTIGDTVSNTTTVENAQPSPADPFVMPCGVAGSPACNVKVDESGMPPPPNLTTQETALDASKDGVLAKIADLESWTPGDWTWTFSLPTGCAPLPMYLGVTVDVCRWQSVMHNIMGMIWALTGIAGLFAIFNRAD